ncbi:MAG: aminotransferase class I/II-fold pyridoxal phosphate-dependent enzyme, partial [Candidatus Thioglobus sp.]
IDKNAKAILAERASLSTALSGIDGLSVYPSQANFILFRAPGANELFETLKSKGVLIKNLSSAQGLTDCLRVTVGSKEENNSFINIVKNYYG